MRAQQGDNGELEPFCPCADPTDRQIAHSTDDDDIRVAFLTSSQRVWPKSLSHSLKCQAVGGSARPPASEAV